MTTTEVTVGGVQAVTTVQTTAVDAKKRKPRAKRRTFKEVATAAHAKGWSEGREQGRKDVEKDYDLLLATNLELGRSVMALETRLANVSLRKLAWSRITALFGGKP
jgi:hypothetical protein